MYKLGRLEEKKQKHTNVLREAFQKKKLQTWAFGSTSADTYLPSELGPP